tara:strand:+ start:324 stop:641 length:318 start_codon:yes stop_codon:yes gene_type:complete
MTPAQSHIATRIMSSIPDTSTLIISESKEFSWAFMKWLDGKKELSASINAGADRGWISGLTETLVSKYAEALNQLVEVDINKARNTEDGVSFVWSIPTPEDLAPF